MFLRSAPRARLAFRARLALASVRLTRKKNTPVLQAICRLKLSFALLPLLVAIRGWEDDGTSSWA